MTIACRNRDKTEEFRKKAQPGESYAGRLQVLDRTPSNCPTGKYDDGFNMITNMTRPDATAREDLKKFFDRQQTGVSYKGITG